MKNFALATLVVSLQCISSMASANAPFDASVKLKPVLFGAQHMYGNTTETAVESCQDYIQFLQSGKIEGLKPIQAKCGAKKNWEDMLSLFGSASEGATAGAVVEISGQLKIAQSGACNGNVIAPVDGFIVGIDNPAGEFEPLPDATSLPVVGTAKDPITNAQASMPVLEKALMAQLSHSSRLVNYKCSSGDLLIQTQ